MRWGRKTNANAAVTERAVETPAQTAGDAGEKALQKARRSLRWARDDALETMENEGVPGATALGAGAMGAGAMGAAAVGAFSIGALAIGALAVGAFAIGRLSVGRARFGEAEIDRLRIGRLEIGEFVRPGRRFGSFDR
jgi:hypothetical protein